MCQVLGHFDPPHDNPLPDEQPPTLLRRSRVHYIHTHWPGANRFACHPSTISPLSTIPFSEPVTSIGDRLVMLVCRPPRYLRGPKSAPDFFHCVLLVGKYYHELILTEMILGEGPDGSGGNQFITYRNGERWELVKGWTCHPYGLTGWNDTAIMSAGEFQRSPSHFIVKPCLIQLAL